MGKATVAKIGDAWAVIVDGHVTARGLSNAQAWRQADRLNREHLSRAEETTDWSVRQFLTKP